MSHDIFSTLFLVSCFPKGSTFLVGAVFFFFFIYHVDPRQTFRRIERTTRLAGQEPSTRRRYGINNFIEKKGSEIERCAKDGQETGTSYLVVCCRDIVFFFVWFGANEFNRVSTAMATLSAAALYKLILFPRRQVLFVQSSCLFSHIKADYYIY